MAENKKYLAAIYDEPGKISTKVIEKDVPEPAAGDILIKLYLLCLPGATEHETLTTNHSTHSGVCHSDLGIMMQSWTHLPFPTEKGQV